MVINVALQNTQYNIYIERGIISHLDQYVKKDCKVLIITDTNIPQTYIDKVSANFKMVFVKKLQPGEVSKSIASFESCQQLLLEKCFSRDDLIIALGGGVVGDLAGFVASTYKRGIAFVNIPTTTLSQIDSSIGGKTAINLSGIKNVVGSFYQPKAVFIDFDTLTTLTTRHYHNGLVEAIKAGLIGDKSLFEEFEKPQLNIEEIIIKAIMVKKAVVEVDEKELGLRKILNFGHTLGHGIEAYYHNEGYYHGEVVGLGMLKVLNDEILKLRLKAILKKLNLPTEVAYDPEKVYEFILNDKKINHDTIDLVRVKTIGHAYIETVSLTSLKELL